METVNDGSFHAVELVASDQTLSLSIDGGTPKSINSISKQSTLNIDSPLYLGGEDASVVCVSHALFWVVGFSPGLFTETFNKLSSYRGLCEGIGPLGIGLQAVDCSKSV